MQYSVLQDIYSTVTTGDSRPGLKAATAKRRLAHKVSTAPIDAEEEEDADTNAPSTSAVRVTPKGIS